MTVHAQIIGTGSAFPEKILTNLDLTSIIDTSEEWIVERTGILERRISNLDNVKERNLGLGHQAALGALNMAQVDPLEIDQIIYATCTADTAIPSMSCALQAKINAKNAWTIDLNAACSGFLYAFVTAVNNIHAGMVKTCLVVGTDLVSSITNWSDRNSCILFGDGSGAIILKACPEKSSCIIGSHLKSDGSQSEILYIPTEHFKVESQLIDTKQMHKLMMQGRDVFKLAVNSMSESILGLLNKYNITPGAITWVVVHQANLRILEVVSKRVGIHMKRFLINLDRYGNTSSGTIPSVLDENVRSEKIQRGDLILLAAFGGGVTWGSSLLRW